MIFPCPSFPQPQIQNDRLLLRFQIAPAKCGSDYWCVAFQSDTSQVDKDIRWADAFLVVYSITDKNSFNNAIQLVETIYDGKGTDELHVALVGNKIDLEHFRKGKKADIV